MKKHFTFTFLAVLTCFVQAQNIDIPDANFKQALLNSYATNPNQDNNISKEEALAAPYVYASSNGISNLKGLEAFVNVETLYLDNNHITSLDLSILSKLTELNVSNNQLDTLDVSKNTALTRLWCSGNQLTSLVLDVNMKYLVCGKNQLQSLNLSDSIMSLDCSGNRLKDLDFSRYSLLTNLDCSDNGISELKVPTAIQSLSCNKNLLKELDLTNDTNLQTLDCNSNQLSSVALPLNLRRLTCSNNHLSALDVLFLAGLEQLDCSHNQIKSLTLSTVLSTLNCSFNLLTELDVSSDKNLYTLICDHNALQVICIPSIYNMESDNYHKDSLAVWSLCGPGNPPTVCMHHISVTGLCEDFKDADTTTEAVEEYAVATDKMRWENGMPSPGNYAYMGMFWTEASNKNGFTATKTRMGDGILRYKISQVDSIYEPFMLVFGSYAEDGQEQKMSVDLTDNKKVMFNLKNKGPSSMRIYVQLQDIHGNSLVFDKSALIKYVNTDYYQIGYESNGWVDQEYEYQGVQSSFIYDFGDAVCGVTVSDDNYIYNTPVPDVVFDYSHVVMVKFFPSGYMYDNESENLVDQEIEISNFSLGNVDFVSVVRDVEQSLSSQTVYKVYDVLGTFVTEGKEEDLHLPTGKLYILKSGTMTKKSIVLE